MLYAKNQYPLVESSSDGPFGIKTFRISKWIIALAFHSVGHIERKTDQRVAETQLVILRA